MEYSKEWDRHDHILPEANFWSGGQEGVRSMTREMLEGGCGVIGPHGLSCSQVLWLNVCHIILGFFLVNICKPEQQSNCEELQMLLSLWKTSNVKWILDLIQIVRLVLQKTLLIFLITFLFKHFEGLFFCHSIIDRSLYNLIELFTSRHPGCMTHADPDVGINWHKTRAVG